MPRTATGYKCVKNNLLTVCLFAEIPEKIYSKLTAATVKSLAHGTTHQYKSAVPNRTRQWALNRTATRRRNRLNTCT